MALVRVTAPAPPLDQLLLPDLKAFLRIDTTTEDAVLSSMLGAAQHYLEGASGVQNRALLTQTWDWKLDAFPGSLLSVEVPLPPLQSVTSISVRGTDGLTTVWAPTNYQVDTGDWLLPGRIRPLASWPVGDGGLNALTIRFVAGYGATLDTIPDSLQQALLGTAAQYYTNRDIDGPAPRWVEALLASFRVEV